MLLCWASSLANAQTFNSLYANSPQIALTQPLEWVAVAKGTMATPDLFEAQPDGWRFQLYDASTVLPTSTQQEVWARFALPMTEPSQTWFVRIPRITVNRVSLFSRDLQGNWQSKSAGDAIAPAEWALRTRTPSFELHTSSSAAQTYYLRFENRNVIVERPMLISPIDYVDGASRVGILIGFLLGMMGLLSVLCLGGFVITGSALFLWFGGFAASLMVSQLVILGYGGWRLWPHNVHLNQVMGWASSCVALATGAWFCAKASYAKDSHIWIYRLLSALAIGSLMLALLAAFGVDVFSRDVRNIWAGIVVTLVIGSLAVMAMSGQPWNGLLLVGLVPIGLATMARLAYNLGWVSQIELAQTAGVFAAVLGLLWLMLALAWRSRASLLATALAAATEGFDAATGLTLERIARRRLPQLLLRASRLKLGCGVIMIGWADHAKIVAAASPQDSAALFAQIGHVLRKVARDIDTAARFGSSEADNTLPEFPELVSAPAVRR